MTETVDEKNVDQPESGSPEISGAGASADGKSYTQEELDRMFAERAKRAESALLKKLGFESVSDAESLVKESKARKEAEMSELQKAQERAAELEKQLAESAEANKAIALQADITAKAARIGIVDPDAAYKLLDKGAISYGDDGKPTNTEALLVAMLKERPYLAGGGWAGIDEVTPEEAEEIKRQLFDKDGNRIAPV